ncbi:hypothetical protein IC789_05280 [Acinetobacter seifertii]|uniref:Uncharacterized protein n=1 Tax=Acinetobacter seifertii TaxID=1530123 RepID=A0A7H2SFH3_9GAMM|nr:hypothetical protein [Acinetobacter seifertii]QNX20739.1 hypothetical protein IC792_05290 [Acinetobacter seifertii]QNX27314.1 hypothetical protein IC791_05155 [Acinetobacter seifertii]QNX38356.1 hypothetical protein IC789_05280 [Acinetobacter seifertii]QNX44227.1 hypothetical protein IC785_15235 [Acinetobacter seifertii]QNX51453.1 hypothetical protein IC783_15130 [Acinetobacter seifertii]
MNNLITASEAFDALQNGFTVLCRPVGDMLEFSELDQFPATIFAKSGYEFCIKLETIELAGITFTKPLTIDEYKAGQDVFVINTYLPSIYIIGFETASLIEAIKRGFVQRDAENAKLQLKAFSKALGFEINNDLSVVRLGEEPKKQRGKKSKAESPAKVIPSEVFPAGNQPVIVITEQINVTTSEDLLVPETSDPDIKPEVNAQFEILLDAIRICQSEKELDSTCANLEKEGFSAEQIKSIDEAKQNRLTELDAQEIDDVATTSMPENFESLVQSIQNAHTPEEVNSVVRYTSKWTEEQRKPLLNEMHKRLSELNQTKQQDDELSPLIVRLQYAPDLNTLEELEREIPSRHPDVHKTLWNMAKKRRGELNAASTPSLDPDYLLGDNF